MKTDQPLRYLLIAGYDDGRRGRPDHRVSLYASAEEARAQFRRLHRRSTAVWAEVVAVGVTGRVATLCRFGDQPAAASAHALTTRSASAGAAAG